VEERIERLCRLFEEEKPYLVSRWVGSEEPPPEEKTPGEQAPVEV